MRGNPERSGAILLTKKIKAPCLLKLESTGRKAMLGSGVSSRGLLFLRG
jgi:hypothetical protein